MTEKYVFAPVEILSADLTPTEFKVLIALYSFRSKNTDTVWPGLDSIAVRCGMADKTRVSKITRSLVEKGYLEKQKRGFTGGNEYKLILPNLDKSANLDKDAMSNLDESAMSNLDDSSKCKEHDTEHDTEQTKVGDQQPKISPNRVVALYHETLPALPRVAKLTKARAGLIRQRIREDLPGEKQWRNFFDYVGQSVFLMGKADPKPGKPPFLADLEWLCRPANFAKIAEGKYHRV